MRHLIVCARCRRQLDAGQRQAGESVRCPCGERVEVPALLAHDSAVVRCSACGAPRGGGEPGCRYCGSTFTVHDSDLDTVCPACMARVTGSARFCDHCGGPILVAQAVAAGEPLGCPGCGGGRQLASRRLGDEPVAVSGCEICGGQWVETAAFEILAARARHAQLGNLEDPAAGGATGAARQGAGAIGTGSAARAGGGPGGRIGVEPGGGSGSRPGDGVGGGIGSASGASAGGRLYRPCARCGKLMNRINFGRKSGVILDFCRGHGMWFDDGELPRILLWIQNGGEQRAHRLDAEQAAAAARDQRLARDADRASAGARVWSGQPLVDLDTAGDLVDLLGAGMRQLFGRW